MKISLFFQATLLLAVLSPTSGQVLDQDGRIGNWYLSGMGGLMKPFDLDPGPTVHRDWATNSASAAEAEALVISHIGEPKDITRFSVPQDPTWFPVTGTSLISDKWTFTECSSCCGCSDMASIDMVCEYGMTHGYGYAFTSFFNPGDEDFTTTIRVGFDNSLMVWLDADTKQDNTPIFASNYKGNCARDGTDGFIDGEFPVTITPGWHTLLVLSGDEGLDWRFSLLFRESPPGLVVQPQGQPVIDPPVITVQGDPHFLTWNGTWYDYMGECDLVLVDAPNFDDCASLTVAVRTTGRFEYSFVECAVVQIGDSILEVSSFGNYFLDGVDGAHLPQLMAGKYPVTYQQVNKKTHKFTIHLGGGEDIEIKTFKDLVSVKLDNLRDHRFIGSRGMLGDYNTGKTMARDGSTELLDPDSMAAEWQVRPEQDGMFFQTARAPQYPEACNAVGEFNNLRGSVSKAEAEKGCGGLSGFQKEACIHDVMATGDLDFAATF